MSTLSMALFLINSRSFQLVNNSFKNNLKCLRTYYSYCNEPTHPVPGKQPKWLSAEEAVSVVKSGNLILDKEIKCINFIILFINYSR